MSLSMSLEVSKRQSNLDNSPYKSPPTTARSDATLPLMPSKSELSSSGVSVGQIDARLSNFGHAADSPGQQRLVSSRELSSSSPAFA